ncbi:MAG TPA: hypothetical protein VN524_20440 [Hyphomicrobiaceae bacterium]|jgi:hypothetical protein|nr:hypothetical protein [Hyphomicrobiaceae bacterium]
MTGHTELMPFFEREEGSLEGFPVESYMAGFRLADGELVVEMKLPAEAVESAVLTGARLSLWLSLDGRLVLDGEGVGDEPLDAASAAGPLGQQTLMSLIAASLDPTQLDAEDDPVAGLTSLRAQLADALALVDGAIERRKKR